MESSSVSTASAPSFAVIAASRRCSQLTCLLLAVANEASSRDAKNSLEPLVSAQHSLVGMSISILVSRRVWPQRNPAGAGLRFWPFRHLFGPTTHMIGSTGGTPGLFVRG